MTSLAAAGVVVVVEADDFLKLTILSLLQTVLVPRTRDLSRPLQGSDKEHSKQCQGAKTGAKASKGFERLYWLYVKSIFVLLSQGWACATVNRERAAGLVFRSKLISEPEKLLSCRL